MKRISALALLGFALCACAETVRCPAARPVRSGGQCIAGDAGHAMRDGAAFDAPDASPCPACASGLVCDRATSECVECTRNEDCASTSNAECVDHACVPCTNDAACAHFETTPACAASGDCVECTDTNSSGCGERTCDAIANVCSTTSMPRTQGVCAPCIGTQHCEEGLACVMTSFADLVSGEEREIGYFCLETGTACTERPFVVEAELVSIAGAAAAVCNLASTCPALNDIGEGCSVDRECGAPDVLDGICNESDHCTISCASADDCTGFLCDLSAPRRCCLSASEC